MHVSWVWILRALCLVGVALLLLTPLSTAFGPLPTELASVGGASPQSWRIETDAQRVRVLIVHMLTAAAGLLALLQLWLLVGRYARGDVFSAASVRTFARFAHALLLYWLALVLGRALVVVALTWDNPPGQRVLIVGLGSDDFVLLLFGAVLAAVAQVMRQAARMAEDVAGFV